MENNEHKINRNLIIGWLLIVVILLVAYFGEFLKGQRTAQYMAVFSAVTAIPAIVCAVLYLRNKSDKNLRYYILGGYLIMYTFVLITGSTTMVFTYILPMLSLIVLYHQPRLVLVMGVFSLAANLIYDVRLYLSGAVNLANSKDVEIQIALLFLCFGYLYVASKMYDEIDRSNKKYLREIEEKQNQIQRVTLQTITTIANLIDAKDEYTQGHSQRVAEYASALAGAMGYSEEQVQNVKFIGLLHDIGKVGIPDSLLNKPGKLTDAEFTLMKQHVVIGSNILKDENMIEGLVDGVRHHHERYDGRGYPDGLAGESIPEIARIVGIADAYDAMTSNRVYRKRLSEETVMAELERCSGTQFDPRIAHIFIELLKKGKLQSLSPDKDIRSDSLGEQSAQILKSIIEIQNAQNIIKDERDYLTNVYNRNTGEKKITECLQDNDGALVLVDMVNLREINSRFGFIAGDYIIKAVGTFLLSYSDNAIISRFGGDEFMCFFAGVTEQKDMESLMSELFGKIEETIHTKKEFERISVCLGGVLSSMTGRDFNTLLVDADKALYYMKQLKKDGWYLFRPTDNKMNTHTMLSKADLGKLVEEMKTDSLYEGTYNMDYPEFVKIYDLMKNISIRNEQDTQLILVTLTPIEEKKTTIEERDGAMIYLENAIRTVLRKSDIMVRFSSMQCLVFLMNLTEKQLETVVNRIMSHFYRSYDKKNMVITYEVADLGINFRKIDKEE